jgi:hypothetical protein
MITGICRLPLGDRAQRTADWWTSKRVGSDDGSRGLWDALNRAACGP